MVAAVADTHAALWLLFGDPRLSAPAKNFFERAAYEGRKIALSPISFVEVAYLVEKKRLPPGAFENLLDAIEDPEHILEEGPFTVAVASMMRQISREAGVPLISHDGRIRASDVRIIW